MPVINCLPGLKDRAHKVLFSTGGSERENAYPEQKEKTLFFSWTDVAMSVDTSGALSSVWFRRLRRRGISLRKFRRTLTIIS